MEAAGKIFLERLRTSDIWSGMQPIDLNEMKTVRLMSRVDTKYVTAQSRLLTLLRYAVKAHYRVQFSPGPLNGYDSVYYDTPGLDMYLIHHNRRLPRRKIRCRTYLESHLSFLEIKEKNNKGRTAKQRVRIPVRDDLGLPQDEQAGIFIAEHTPYRFARLVPSLQTVFHRITLVNPQKTERITIDVGVRFYNFNTHRSASLDGLVIIELKQDGRYPSMMKSILNASGIKPFRVSKYCIGIALTDAVVKSNRFRRKLHFMNKIKNQL